jgi:putative oxidoreductase
MAYAYWSVHSMTAVLPIVNHGEAAILYCFIFLFMSARGSGMFSIDYFGKGQKLKELKK